MPRRRFSFKCMSSKVGATVTSFEVENSILSVHLSAGQRANNLHNTDLQLFCRYLLPYRAVYTELIPVCVEKGFVFAEDVCGRLSLTSSRLLPRESQPKTGCREIYGKHLLQIPPFYKASVKV